MDALSISPGFRQAPYLRVVPNDDADPPTVSADEDAAVFAAVGCMGLGFYRALLLMEDQGIPITYATAMGFTGFKRRAVFYYVKDLAAIGAVTVERTTGGRGNESVINCARNRAQNGAAGCTVTPKTVQETVQKTVHRPPYNPPCVKDVENEEDSPPTPSRPKKPLPENGTAQQIVAAYCRHVGIEEPVSYRKAVGQASRLAKAGILPDDVPALHARAAKWAGSADLGTMVMTAERYLQEKAAPPANGNGTLPPELLRDIEADKRSFTDLKRPVPQRRLDEHRKWIESYHRTGEW